MFVRAPRENNIIRLPEKFVRLVEINDKNDLSFEVRHFVNQSDIVKKNARLVRISVSTRIFQKTDVTQTTTQARPTTKQLIKNLQKLVPSARNAINNFQNYVIAKKIVDNATGLDSDLVSQLQNTADPTKIDGLYRSKATIKTVRELNSSNDNKAILQVNSSINDLPSFSMRQLIESNIIKFGFDPSHVTNIVNDSVISPYEATTGIRTKTQTR
jgi:hypothetical protein